MTNDMPRTAAGAAITGATVFVDPQCPFAWITYQWLRQVEHAGAAAVTVELMSLACVNEHQDLDPDYRVYNDDAWAAARVGAALLASEHAHHWPAFYDIYGHRRHVDGLRDNTANIALTLRDLDLPDRLADAADNSTWDHDLRCRTQAAVAGVDGPGGTPITRLGDRFYFGPVMTSIPDVDESVSAWNAMTMLATIPGFASVATRRDEDLRTSR